ncbi:MAG: DinB family protein [Ardenticatenaceae bacterium]|nr:DinB family protein [Ardenticatenaceae bacterium]
MTSDPVRAIIAKLEDDYQRLRETIAGVPETRLTSSSAGDGWSAREILAHLANAEREHREVAKAILDGRTFELANFDLDRWNQAGVARRARQDVRTILDDLEAEHRAMIAFAAALSPEELEKKGRHPALGELSVRKLLRIVGLHQRMHQREIVALVAAGIDV